MLFLVKNRWLPSLAVAFVLAAVAWWASRIGSLSWSWQLGSAEWRGIGWATLVLGLSDGGGHGLLLLLFGDAYRRRFLVLAEVFRPQRNREIVCGGVLAAAEELAFRGVLLEGLRSLAGWPTGTAIAVSAAAFGLAHALPHRLLRPFVVWAIWEGVLLGGVYVLSGSLAVSCLIHGAHDMVGFAIFRWQRTRHEPPPRAES